MTGIPLPFLFKQPPLARAEDFARFFEQSHEKVFRYVMVLTAGNQAEAEDVTAEAFLRAWEKRGQFTGSPAAALGWVIAIARNRLIDQRRAENAHPTQALPEDDLPEPAADLEDLLIGDEQVDAVLAALQTLPFAQRNLVTLRYALGWPVKDIAAHLGRTENAVSVDLRRALARVQRQLTLTAIQTRSVK